MIIDHFFDSFEWHETTRNHVADFIPYADLVNMVDFHNRWVYQGSVTTPPCAQKVFWNQISTVYPIKQHHVDAFKRQLAREIGPYAPSNLGEIGNYREIQKEDFHNVHYISNPDDPRRREGPRKGDDSSPMGRVGDMLRKGIPHFELEEDGDDVLLRISDGAIKTTLTAAIAAVSLAFNL